MRIMSIVSEIFLQLQLAFDYVHSVISDITLFVHMTSELKVKCLYCNAIYKFVQRMWRPTAQEYNCTPFRWWNASTEYAICAQSISINLRFLPFLANTNIFITFVTNKL